MLSSPLFSSSTTMSMKTSLLSLLHPSQSQNQQQQDLSQQQQQQQATVGQNNHTLDSNSNTYKQNHSPLNSSSINSTNDGSDENCSLFNTSATSSVSTATTITSNITTPSSLSNTKQRRVKCVKMKLFDQPLDKLFSPKAMKHLNNAINDSISASANSIYGTNLMQLLNYEFTMQNSTSCKRRILSSCSLTSNNRVVVDKFGTDNNNNINNNNNHNTSNISTTSEVNCSTTTTTLAMNSIQREQLLLSVIPEPIRNLLNELYLRGPSTIGIFRKSPNAKHCKELRQKLETDSQSSIEHFQVTVIASVFKVSWD